MKGKWFTLLVATLLTPLTSATVKAQEQSAPGVPLGLYGSAQLALSDVDGYDSGLALVFTAGMDMNPDIQGGLATEFELTTTISEPEAKALGQRAEVSYYTAALYGAYGIPVSEVFGIRARLGLLYENVDVDAPIGGGKDDDFGVSFGVGGTYQFSPQFAAIAEYTYIEEDIFHFSAGGQIRF